MKVEFNKISDLYGEDDDGNPVLIKSGIKSKFETDTNYIISVEELIQRSGKVSKTKCTIYIRELGPVIVQEKYKKVKELKEGKESINKIGFRK